MTRELVLATANADKAAEIAAILAGWSLVPRPAGIPDVEETEDTLEGNARLKARTLVSATGLAAVADDTGLSVVALGGAPGVRTSRYAGEGATYAENVAKLLVSLEGVDYRRAHFRTVALVAFPDGSSIAASGVVAGTIARSARGEGGFGYDSVFVPDEGGGLTFAEMAPGHKHAISHRGRAFRELAARLPDHLR